MAGTSRKKQDLDKENKAESAKSAGNSGKGGSRKKTDTAGRKETAAQKSSTSSGKKTSGGSRKKAEPEASKEESFMGAEVAIIGTFALSVLLFLSNFGLCGAVGDICRGVMLGIFGSIGYLAPILLFVGTCFYMSNRGNRRALVKMAAVLLLLLALCGLDQMIFGGGVREGGKLFDYYKQSGTTGDGGGFVGGLLAVLLGSALGTVGTYVILLVAMAIGAVCITEKSLVNFVKRGSGRAYEYAKEDMSRRRELHEEKREERRRLREEQRVRGVDLEATNLTDVPLMREFAAGVPEGTVLSGEDDWQEEETKKAGHDTEPAEREEDSKKAANPADVFRGSISMPHYEAEETLSEADVPQKQQERKESAEAASDSGAESLLTTEGTESDSDHVLKQIYVRRDTRTVGELSGDEELLKKGGHPGYTRVEPAGDREYDRSFVDDLMEDRLAGTAVSESGEGLRKTDFESEEPRRTGFESEESGRTGLEAEEQKETGFGDEEPGRTSFEALEPQEPEEWEVLDAEEPEEAAAGASREDIRGNAAGDGYYKTTQDGEGVNYDSFFVPEEPKTVVTASGKVIDTDTEVVRKTLEKKREEKKVLPEAEMNISQQIEKKAEKAKREYVFPSLELLKRPAATNFSEKEYRETAIKLQQTLQNFGVGVTVTNISCGPSVTRYELQPEQGVKVSKIVSLADDIKLNLAAADIRIEAPIPGKAAVGIEVPNKENNVVFLRELLESEAFRRHGSRLAFAVGKDIGGQVVVTDIAKMPHLLIAGATGSGKSVCINTLIMSVIYKAKPEEVKLIMIDPKVVELSVYNGIPHLLIPVVTDAKKASGALNWAVGEMMDRYGKFAKYNVRDLKGYNEKVESIEELEDDKKPEKLPQIIIIVDELADLMMVAPGEVEDAICRLAQLARAAGIHLVIATQRPSVNVITGLIKANIPSRIAFSVSSGVDSRTIIDMNGAEKLLGKGDMLFYPSGYQKPQRVQGAFVSDKEVSRVVDFLAEQGAGTEYSPEVQSRINTAALGDGGGGERDAYFVQAGRFIIEKDKASIGMLQRMFKIGFNRAARIMDQLAEAGVVGEEEGTKPRKILMSMEQFENMLEE